VDNPHHEPVALEAREGEVGGAVQVEIPLDEALGVPLRGPLAELQYVEGGAGARSCARLRLPAGTGRQEAEGEEGGER
jgi:hypothetical protein